MKFNIKKWKIMQIIWIKRLYIQYLLKQSIKESNKLYNESLKNNQIKQ